MKTEHYIIIGIAAILFAGGFATGRLTASNCPEVVATSTVIDTLSRPVPRPSEVAEVRVDTVRLKLKPAKPRKPDTVTQTPSGTESLNAEPANVDAEVLVPITRKVYATPDYRAVVSGFRPSLDSMEVYRQTVTKTVQLPPKKKWLALTVGPSVGYGLDGQIVPAVSATLGIIIISK